MDSSPLVANCARGEEKAERRDCTDARPSCLRVAVAEAVAVVSADPVPSPPVDDDDDDDDDDDIALLVVVFALGVKRVARAVHAAHCTAGLAVSPRPLKQPKQTSSRGVSNC